MKGRVTMMAAATLFGFLGVLLAVPLGAVLKILIGHAMRAYLDSRFYQQTEAGQGEAAAASGDEPNGARVVGLGADAGRG